MVSRKVQSGSGMSTVALDIETIADRSLMPMLPPVEAAGNLKDPEKIKADIEKKQEKQIVEMGLDPRWNLICCVGLYDGTSEPQAIVLQDESEAGERALLEATWEALHRYELFVSFNGSEFDVPIINLHSLFRRVRPAVRISTRRYQIDNHVDVRAVLSGWEKFAPGNLDFYLQRVLGRSKPKQIGGSDVQHYWDVGMKDDIATYCMGDAKDTWDLYQAVKTYFPM